MLPYKIMADGAQEVITTKEDFFVERPRAPFLR